MHRWGSRLGQSTCQRSLAGQQTQYLNLGILGSSHPSLNPGCNMAAVIPEPVLKEVQGSGKRQTYSRSSRRSASILGGGSAPQSQPSRPTCHQEAQDCGKVIARPENCFLNIYLPSRASSICSVADWGVGLGSGSHHLLVLSEALGSTSAS